MLSISQITAIAAVVLTQLRITTLGYLSRVHRLCVMTKDRVSLFFAAGVRTAQFTGLYLTIGVVVVTFVYWNISLTLALPEDWYTCLDPLVGSNRSFYIGLGLLFLVRGIIILTLLSTVNHCLLASYAYFYPVRVLNRSGQNKDQEALFKLSLLYWLPTVNSFMLFLAPYRACFLAAMINGFYCDPSFFGVFEAAPYGVVEGSSISVEAIGTLISVIVAEGYGVGVWAVGVIIRFITYLLGCLAETALADVGVNGGNFPWVDGFNATRCREVLQAQYEYSATAYPQLHSFLTEHCLHILQAPTGDTGVPINRLSPAYLSSGVYPNMTPTMSAGLLTGTNDVEAGVYVFFNRVSEGAYIGSSINMPIRLKHHYQIARWEPSEWSIPRLYSAFNGEEGFASFVFGVVAETTNYYNLYSTLNPTWVNDPNRDYITLILYTFSQYEARLVEDSLIVATNPLMNNDGNVRVTFPVNWEPTDRFKPSGTECVVTYGSPPVEVVFPSYQQAATAIKVAKTTLIRSVGYSSGLTSPIHGHFTVNTLDGVMIKGLPPSQPVNYSGLFAADYDYDRVDYKALDRGTLYVFDAEGGTLLDTFLSAKDAVVGTGIPAIKVTAAINKVAVKAPLLGGCMVFLAVHWDTLKNPLYALGSLKVLKAIQERGQPVVCSSTEGVFEYPSIIALARSFNTAKPSSEWVSRHLKEGRPFIKGNTTYHLCYANQYTGTVTPTKVTGK